MSETNNSETPIEQVDTDLAAAEKWARSNPNNLPPQFGGDPEKFLSSYKEMRATLTRTQQELAASKKAPEPIKDTAPSQPIDNLKVPDKPAEPDTAQWQQWGSEIQATGSLSPETREKIKTKFNVPDDVIDGYMLGIKARQQEVVSEAAKVVGSQDDLKKIIAWAQDNLNDVERASVNESLAKPGWQNVLLGLKTRMDMSNPEPKARIGTVSGVPAAIKPFATSKEMTTALRDPRYKYDPEYQAVVQERIRISGAMKNNV